jgi:hypothetical protein
LILILGTNLSGNVAMKSWSQELGPEEIGLILFLLLVASKKSWCDF